MLRRGYLISGGKILELIEVAECLVDKIKKDYDGDVSLVHIHGSYFYNDTHDLSDLDLYFVPKTERGYSLSHTFILNGIGYDYFALSWDRLERIANHNEKLESIITDGEVLYYHSQDDLIRFNKLKEKAGNIIAREKLIDNGKEIMKEIHKEYFNIVYSNDISEIRKAVIVIINKASFLLTLINSTPIKRGRKHLKSEILSMKIIPEDFENTYNRFFTETDISAIRELLFGFICNIEKLLPHKVSGTFYDNFKGFYEEMIQSYNKIYHACDIGDIYTPLYTSVELTEEIEELFERSNCSFTLPDIIGSYDPQNLEKIRETAKKHQEEFVKILKDNGIRIRSFNGIDELKQFLEKL